jgi:hypothetical protein
VRSIDLTFPILVALALPAGCESSAVNPSGASSSNRLPPETSQAAAPPPAPADALGQKFEAWLAAINSGDRERIGAVWSGAKDATLRVSADMALAERSGRLELFRVEDATSSEMLAIVRSKENVGWLCVQFDVEEDAPHVIQAIALRPTGSLPERDKGAGLAPLDDKARAQVVQGLIRELHRSYVFPDKVAVMDRELNARLRTNAYDSVVSRLALAHALNLDLQRLSHDKHLHVDADCSRGKSGSGAESHPSPSAPKPDRPRVFGDIRRLDGNVAYIEIATFGVPGPAAKDEIRDTMSKAADAAAIIFDVSRNGGGEPETVALVSSYLFGAEPVHLNSIYWRVPGRTDDFFTDPRVQGAKFGPTKPVYVLTSGRTFSAAEEFTYNLQTRKRATIVGETTGGGANPGDVVPLPENFSAFVPNGRAINPITNTNWEGTGVKPDVETTVETALETALKLALAQVASAGDAKRDGGAVKTKK